MLAGQIELLKEGLVSKDPTKNVAALGNDVGQRLFQSLLEYAAASKMNRSGVVSPDMYAQCVKIQSYICSSIIVFGS